MSNSRPSLEDRFWSKVNKTETCWLWVAALTHDGYGRVHVEGKTKLAHRISFEWVKGQIPECLEIDHLCRVRNCVNPAHLEAVTRDINFQRGLGTSVGHKVNAARRKALTHCPLGHPYSVENTYIHGGGKHCKACQALSCAKWRQKKKVLQAKRSKE